MISTIYFGDGCFSSNGRFTSRRPPESLSSMRSQVLPNRLQKRIMRSTSSSTRTVRRAIAGHQARPRLRIGSPVLLGPVQAVEQPRALFRRAVGDHAGRQCFHLLEGNAQAQPYAAVEIAAITAVVHRGDDEPEPLAEGHATRRPQISRQGVEPCDDGCARRHEFVGIAEVATLEWLISYLPSRIFRIAL